MRTFQSLLESRFFHGENKVPISDWLGELQTTPRKTLKRFVKALYLLALALALALLALALAQCTNGERLTYGNTKKKHGSGGVMRRCRRSGDLLGRLQ